MPTTHNNTEKEWLARAATGDEQAFRRLYDLYAGKVYTMALSYLKSHMASQDMVQEIFLKVWEKKSDLPTLNSFPAWLHTVTRNYLINTLQKKIPANFHEDLSRQSLPDDQPLPEQQLDLKEMRELVQEAVAKLPPRQRQVYRLSREQGMTLEQIAGQLGLSYHTIREHMSQALKNIRLNLLEHYGEMGLLILLFIGL